MKHEIQLLIRRGPLVLKNHAAVGVLGALRDVLAADKGKFGAVEGLEAAPAQTAAAPSMAALARNCRRLMAEIERLIESHTAPETVFKYARRKNP